METQSRFALLSAFLLAATGCSAQTKTMAPGGASPPPPSSPAPSQETAALLARLGKLADSARNDDQRELARLLGQVQTLDQLDDPKVRDRSRTVDLRIGLITTRLRTNSTPAAAETLAALTRSESFNASWQRQELLVRTLATQHPLLSDSLAFLDAQSQPDSVNLHIAIEALCDNGTEPAIALLGRKLADPNHESIFKIGWMRGPILRHRRDPEVLRAAEKWLAPDALDHELRAALAEALFDYRPHEWYPGREDLPRPPAEAATGTEAARFARRIGHMVMASDYPPSVKAAVRQTLASLPAEASGTQP